MNENNSNKINIEFVALMASLMSIVALSIDALLPALSDIGLAISVKDSVSLQLLVSMIFLGLGIGQLLFGPLSDTFGRKPIIYIGLAIYSIASIICVMSSSLEMMILGRVLQGIGLAAPYSISVSIVRDSYKGDALAKIMSFVMVIFILVPVIAPALGQVILNVFDWKSIFYFQLIFGVIISFWLWRRQPETLKEEYRSSFNLKSYKYGLTEFFKQKSAIAYTIITGYLSGAFMVYLGAAQHIFVNQYGLQKEFPYIFAGIALTIGVATFLNGMLVMRFGMRKLTFIGLALFCVISGSYVFLFLNSNNPSLYVLLFFIAFQFLAMGLLFGNVRAISMESIGHIAGIGAAITGFLSTLIAVPIGVFVGSYIKTTSLPLFIGFAVCGILSLLTFVFVEKTSRKQPQISKETLQN